MNNRVFWGAIALAVAAMFAAATVGDAARRMPNRDGELIAGHDGSDQQMVYVDSDGNVSVEFGANATAFTVGGPAADDAAASGNPVQIGCKHNTTTNAVEDGDISYVNCGTLGDIYVSGRVASGATDSGNPVKIGGQYLSTPLTLTNGQRGDALLDTRQNIKTTFCGVDTVTCAVTGNGNDGGANNTGILAIAHMKANNGSTGYDSWRNNNNITVLASAARTTTTASSDLTNYNASGIHLVIDVTAFAASPSVVCTVQGKDALSGQYYTILASAAITGTGTTVLRVFPAATAAANTIANDIMPRTWRVNCVHADSDSITYSIGASVIL